MLVSVKAFNEFSPLPSECTVTEGGFFCGKCGWKHLLGLSQPSACRHCGARFEYQFETEPYVMGVGCVAPGRLFFCNAQDPVHRIDDFGGGTVVLPHAATESSREFRESQAAH